MQRHGLKTQTPKIRIKMNSAQRIGIKKDSLCKADARGEATHPPFTHPPEVSLTQGALAIESDHRGDSALKGFLVMQLRQDEAGPAGNAREPHGNWLNPELLPKPESTE